MTQRFEGEVHALRAENAALRAEIAALLAASGAPHRSSAAPNNAADAADPPRGSVPPSHPPAFPDHLRTWESPSGADDVLTGADLERYARHVALPSFGAAKQAALARAKVLIVGVGGLGSPAALYLAAAGVGRLALADADHVEVSNLHRQIIHGERFRGVPKAVSAQTALRGLNSRCVVETHLDGFRDENALELVADCDCVLDCTDNVRTRYLISDACALAGVPLVAAAAVGLEGQLTVYCRARAPGAESPRVDDDERKRAANEKKSSTTRNHPPPRPSGDDTPCYRCVFPTPPARRDCASCAAAGVLGPVPGIMGVLQALEAIKALAGLGDGAAGRMLCFDATAAPGRSFRAFALRPRNPTCVACGDEEVRAEKKKITPETLANGEDLTAFVERRDSHAEGDENAKTTCARPSKPGTPPLRKTSSSLSRGEEDRAAYAALVGALDDAKSAAARNRDQGRGSPGGVVGFPAEDDPGEAARRADLFLGTKKGPPRFAGVDVSGAPPRVEASFLPPVALDCSARPPLSGSEPGPNRVSPSALRAALAGSTLAGGSSSVPSGGGGGGVMNGGGGVYSEPAVLVVDVRPRRLSDAACLRRALRVPLRELEARVGEVWAASDALRDAAARDARNRSLDGGGPGPGAVYVVCSRGNDSQLAEAFLRAAGLPVVGDVVGGMEAWRKEIDPTFPKLV